VRVVYCFTMLVLSQRENARARAYHSPSAAAVSDALWIVR
jgi:hypothetical protein